MTGHTFLLTLTGTSDGGIWGTDIYTDDSNLATAAVHANVLNEGETGTILIAVLPGQDSYSSTQRNGITSEGFGPWHGSYRIERLE